MSSRRAVGIAFVIAALVTIAVAAWRMASRAPEPASPDLADSAARSDPPPTSAPVEPAWPPAAAPPAAEPAPELPLGLGAVDLEEVRAALPDNLYWTSAAPTTDPALLEEREREKAFRNEQYGKVLSGTGNDAEILDYYEHRMQTSTDYVQLVDHLLEHYGSDLTDQDLTLLHVAKRLHQARLEEIPRRLQEARERRTLQDEARRQWLEDEAKFRGDSESPP